QRERRTLPPHRTLTGQTFLQRAVQIGVAGVEPSIRRRVRERRRRSRNRLHTAWHAERPARLPVEVPVELPSANDPVQRRAGVRSKHLTAAERQLIDTVELPHV